MFMKTKSTTFDDVFRTIAQKMPFMMVALINEAFGESYPDNVKIQQLRNEFITKDKKIITDSLFLIKDKYYHIECQSNPDSTMEIRMIEYDFMIAHEHAEKKEGRYEINFPESAVLYLRHNKSTPDKLKVVVNMPDGRSFDYETKIIKAKDYTQEEIFRKKLLVLVPFYLMRYEDQFSEMEQNEKEKLAFFESCEKLRKQLENEVGNRDIQYADMIDLITKVSDHILEDHKKIRKGVKDIMGGKILELRSEKLLKKGRTEGRAEDHKASIEKLANHYLETGAATNKDDAVKMAETILGK